MPGNWKSVDGRWMPMDDAARRECNDLKIHARGIHVTKDPEFQLRAHRLGLKPDQYLAKLKEEHEARLKEEALAFGEPLEVNGEPKSSDFEPTFEKATEVKVRNG